jgi:hypothetical protein
MSVTPNSPRDLRAPEGATCAEHPGRPALFTCPRCGSYACVVCFHTAIDRCQRCLARDPTEAAPPLPWEHEGEPLFRRYLRTLGSAFAPVRTAPAFAHAGVAAARRFMLLSVVPLALLAGVIPHTRTLLFEGGFKVRVIGTPMPGQLDIVLDIARAMGLQVLLTAVECLCVAMPFVSLCRAYAPQRMQAAVRSMYYRLWLLPAFSLLFYLVPLALPAQTGSSPPLWAAMVALVLVAGSGILRVLLFVAMNSTARIACGLGPWLSIVVVVVPFGVWVAAKPFVDEAAIRLLPAIDAKVMENAQRG